MASSETKNKSNARVYDFLVIGSGVAGLSYALKVAEFGKVAVVTKKESAESNTNYAQGGIAAVIHPEDSFEEHIEDTLVAGAGLCNEDAVRAVITEGPDRLRDLIALGAEFTQENGEFHLGREGGHSRNRIVHATDATGREVERALLFRTRNHPNIEILEYHFALELITEHHLGQVVTRLRDDMHCFGAYVLADKTGEVFPILAKVTLLAAGGAGQVYTHTTNPTVATGDGIAMAYRAKARVANMEFVQVHPTSLYHPEASSFLISEAVRGEGAILRNQAGVRFMSQYDERGELAPRDIVARAIDDQLKQSGENFVWLDISHVPEKEVLHHFPTISERCKSFGIDMTKDPIPVVPAAHYFCGGVVTDLTAKTSIAGLLACGEVTCTGLHGANRLASNSLLEALVFSERAFKSAIEYWESNPADAEVPVWDDKGTEHPQEWILVSQNRKEVQSVMSNYVGIVRSDLRLDRAYRRVEMLYEETENFFQKSKVSVPLCELRNLVAIAHLIIRCAKMRRESRGLHYTTDFLGLDEKEKRDSVV